MSNPNPKEVLFQMIREKSYREGDFTLSSGQKSSFYIDLKPTILHPVGAKAIGDLAFEWIRKNNLKFDGVGGLTLGADPIVMAISRGALDQGVVIPASMIRKEPKKHGTSRFIEGIENFKQGSNFLVVEDVVTTGASAKKAIEILRNEGFKVSHVLSIVDRESGGSNSFQSLGVQYHAIFKISDLKSGR
jgi:orotate phosphoribosyltransferase